MENSARQIVTGTLLIGVYTGIFFFSTTRSILPVEMTASSVLLAAVLAVLSFWDFETYSLPDPLVVILAVGGVATFIARDPGILLLHSFASVTVGLLVLVMNQAYLRVRGRDGIGMGDAKLLAAGAIWVGATGILTAILWACVTGLVHCVGGAAVKKKLSGNHKIPFGPHIALGIWLVWLFGPAM